MKIIAWSGLWLLMASCSLAEEIEPWRFWNAPSISGQNTCYTGVRYASLVVGFEAVPKGPINGFIMAALPGTTRTTWQVEGYEVRAFQGGAYPNGGGYRVTGVPLEFLAEVAAGQQLTIDTLDGRPDRAFLPLEGSRAAITAFQDCYDWEGRNAPAASASSTSVTELTAPAAASPAPRLSYETAMDRLTSYTTVLGRGVGCNFDTQVPQQRVYAWLKQSFAAEHLEEAKAVYLATMAIATKQQMSGQTPDTCASLAGTIATFPWPE